MNAEQLFRIEKNNDNIEGLLDIVDNGHPSITESHHCYTALEELNNMNGCQLIELFLK